MNYYNHNYRIPPADTSNVVDMLNYFGCRLEGMKSGETFSPVSISSISCFDSNRLPKLSCPKSNNPNSLLCLSFPGPQGYGLQSFSFEPDALLSLVKGGDGDKVGENGKEASSRFLTFIISNFIINKTIIARVYYHKRGYFKLPLYPSVSKISKNLKKNNHEIL